MTWFRLLPERSRLETESRSSVHPIHTSTGRVNGFIEGAMKPDGTPDLNSPYRAELEVPVEALSSGNRIQDLEMQRRMDARRYPTITVRLKKAWKVDGDERYRALFEVTAIGRTRPYEEAFTMRVDGRRISVEGRHSFDMRDFGVSPPRFLNMKVEPEVVVSLRLEGEQSEKS